MEKLENSGDKTLRHMQPEDAAHQDERPLRKMLHDLRKALLDSKREKKELAAENAALKEQIASKDISWQETKKKLLDKQDSVLSTLSMTKHALDSLTKTLESGRAKQKEIDTENMEMEKKLKEKEKEVHSLQKQLELQHNVTEALKSHVMGECKRVKEMELGFNQSIVQFNAAWEYKLGLTQEQANTKLKALQETFDKKVQDIHKKDEAATSARTEMMVLVEENTEHLANLKKMEAKMQQKESEWQQDMNSLEKKLRAAQSQTEELQKQASETEKSWLAKQEDWFNKASRLEVEIEHLILQNTQLQELALKTDKYKAKNRKEEKKAKKEAEKEAEKGMKEKKKQEEKERKDKKEQEK